MSFVIAGSLHSYANSMKMQMKWEQKQSKSDYTADGATSISEKLRKEASGIGSPPATVPTLPLWGESGQS